MTRRTLLIGLLGGLIAGRVSAAPAPAAYELAVDPRFELLGVVRQLAGRGGAIAGAAEYRDKAESRFSPFRGHPAVKSFEALSSEGSREAALATVLIYYSPPPELALLDKTAYFHYLRGRGEREEMDRFLEELRAFSRAADFMGFFAENRDLYRKIEGKTRQAFAGLDPVAALESYLGMPLSSRVHYIQPLLYETNHNFIVPYPLPETAAGAESFDVYTLGVKNGDYYFWNELLFVFIDPSFHYFDALNVPVKEEFYGPEVARCRRVAPDCAKSYVIDAIRYRLLKKNRPSAARSFDLGNPYVRALAGRLEEYERRRDLYPTLWDFYPRLLSVFPERAFPSAPPAKLAAAVLPPIRKAADFFDPKRNPDAAVRRGR